jgi:hypothetical protein
VELPVCQNRRCAVKCNEIYVQFNFFVGLAVQVLCKFAKELNEPYAINTTTEKLLDRKVAAPV